jgi:hypothetical protein
MLRGNCVGELDPGQVTRFGRVRLKLIMYDRLLSLLARQSLYPDTTLISTHRHIGG